MLPDLKRFTLRSILLQGYNNSLITSEKTFSLFLGKRLSHNTCRLWIVVGVTFPFETARALDRGRNGFLNAVSEQKPGMRTAF